MAVIVGLESLHGLPRGLRANPMVPVTAAAAAPKTTSEVVASPDLSAPTSFLPEVQLISPAHN